MEKEEGAVELPRPWSMVRRADKALRMRNEGFRRLRERERDRSGLGKLLVGN